MSDQQMKVIGDGASLEQRALVVFDDSADVSVEFVAVSICEEWFPILRGKDQMHEDLGEGLWHGLRPFRAGESLGIRFPGRCPGLSH